MAWPGLGGPGAAHPPHPAMARGSAPVPARLLLPRHPSVRRGSPASVPRSALARPGDLPRRTRSPRLGAWSRPPPCAAPGGAAWYARPCSRRPACARPPRLALPLPSAAMSCPAQRGLELGPTCLWRVAPRAAPDAAPLHGLARLRRPRLRCAADHRHLPPPRPSHPPPRLADAACPRPPVPGARPLCRRPRCPPPARPPAGAAPSPAPGLPRADPGHRRLALPDLPRADPGHRSRLPVPVRPSRGHCR
eukprot:XP_020407722.1 basic proline-rich protein-like [Zea mays]